MNAVFPGKGLVISHERFLRCVVLSVIRWNNNDHNVMITEGISVDEI